MVNFLSQKMFYLMKIPFLFFPTLFPPHLWYLILAPFLLDFFLLSVPTLLFGMLPLNLLIFMYLFPLILQFLNHLNSLSQLITLLFHPSSTISIHHSLLASP
ncbi:hypothetical protein VIGAN_10124200 [Vigna angularis var. angularis]|uniref:Uncharacterized protein n=1 Tax=Vigna angularis var. angularis TaxID=157739 RepID=A0A0S3T4G4_PHAAN|nr:hypothetical protein VIGAN_10124200 [Vigna angularis var. angularis]